MARTIETHYSKFIIRFIQDIEDTDEDEILSIVPIHLNPNTTVASQSYKVTLKTQTTVQYEFTLADFNRLCYYIGNLFNLLKVDQDPPKAVQIDAPNGPSVLLRRQQYGDESILRTIQNLLWTAAESWPSRTVVRLIPQPSPTPPPANPRPQPRAGARHLFFDEDTGSVLTEPRT